MKQASEHIYVLLHSNGLISSNVLLGLSSCPKVWLLIRQHFKHQVKNSLPLTLSQKKLTQIFVQGEGDFSISTGFLALASLT